MKIKKDFKIHIVGAGVSGLIAAQVLENHGYTPTILEASSKVGGRVKTDIIDGYQLDHGFQVLLDAYPKAQQYLDYSSLELQSFLPGAIIFKNSKQHTIGDPLRNSSFLLSTLISSIGTFSDKLKIFKLNLYLKKKSLKSIFNDQEYTTMMYLKNKGFTNAMIEQFFKPFFSGIFLEPHLQTSSRMFEFVYKMFGEGLAVLPKAGIGEISAQLASKLNKTNIVYNNCVQKVTETEIILNSGNTIKSDFTVIATEASNLVHNLRKQTTQWHSCDNLYFEVSEKTMTKPLIGLISDKNAIVNNIFYCNSLITKSKGAKELLSVTIVKKHQLEPHEIIEKVVEDLGTYCNIKNVKFLKHYKINNALPKLSNIQHEMQPSETKLTDTIFLAGDQLLNGSLNAAMTSGENAAISLIAVLEKNTITLHN